MTFLHLFGSDGIVFFNISNKAFSSSVVTVLESGNLPSLSYYSSNFFPSKIIIVASPPSSTMMFGPFPSGHVRA